MSGEAVLRSGPLVDPPAGERRAESGRPLRRACQEGPDLAVSDVWHLWENRGAGGPMVTGGGKRGAQPSQVFRVLR